MASFQARSKETEKKIEKKYFENRKQQKLSSLKKIKTRSKQKAFVRDELN